MMTNKGAGRIGGKHLKSKRNSSQYLVKQGAMRAVTGVDVHGRSREVQRWWMAVPASSVNRDGERGGREGGREDGWMERVEGRGTGGAASKSTGVGV